MIMDTIISPIIKDEGDVTNSYNYCPVAIPCIASKSLRNKLERSALLCCHTSSEDLCQCFDIGKPPGVRNPRL